MENKKETLDTVDIVLSIYNQERLIKKVLNGIWMNTITPFNLILIFDGCTDNSQKKALGFLDKKRATDPRFLKEITVRQTQNVHETLANNIGFRLVKNKYMITLQDDVVVTEYAWEKRLTYPLRRFNDIFAVTARGAQDLLPMENGKEKYMNTADKTLGLPRNIFAIRDVINRGPVALKTECLKVLGYLNEAFAPGSLDDADLSLRAWRDHKWRCGAFWVGYISKPEWGKSRAKDSTMAINHSNEKNVKRLYHDHSKYVLSQTKHSIDYKIEDRDIVLYDGFIVPVRRELKIRKFVGKLLEKIGIKRDVIGLLRKLERGLKNLSISPRTTNISDWVNSLSDESLSKKCFRKFILSYYRNSNHQ